MEKLRKIILLYLIGGEAGAKSITAQYLAYHLQYQGSLHDIDRAKILLILIDHVKNLDYKSQEGTALAGLSIRYNKKLVEHLLKKNANPNIADANGTTPLFWAVKSGNTELVELLLQYKADKSMKDSMGMTPFEYALKTENKEIINILKN